MPESASSPVEVWTIPETAEISAAGFWTGTDSLFFTGVLHGTFIPEGRIVLALGGETRLVFLDAAGKLVATARQGPGPGEFQATSGLFIRDDTVAVWDVRNGRMSLYHGAVLVRQYAFRPPAAQRVIGMWDDDIIVTTPTAGQALRVAELVANAAGETVVYVAEGQRRPYFIWNELTAQPATILGAIEPPPAYFVLDPRDPAAPDVPRAGMSMSLASTCLPEVQHVLTKDALLVADSREGTLSRIDRTGEMSTLYRNADRPNVTQEVIERHRERVQSMDPRGLYTAESKSRAIGMLGGVGDPIPAVWTDIVVDLRGTIWLRRASCYGSEEVTTWDVIDAQGQRQAIARVPASVRILSVDDRRILTVVTGAFGVQHLNVYRVVPVS